MTSLYKYVKNLVALAMRGSITECYELRENEGLTPILADGRIVNFVKENGYSK